MKRVKLLLMMLFAVVVMACTGCSSKSNVSMTEDGKGTQVIKIGFDRSLYGHEGVKVSNIDEIATIVKNKINNSDIVIKTEKDLEQDYIVASFEYESVQDMDNKIKKIVENMNSEYDDNDFINEDFEEDYIKDSAAEKEQYVSALKEYLTINNIEFNAETKNFEMFINKFESCILDLCVQDGMKELDLDAYLDKNFNFYNFSGKYAFRNGLYYDTSIIKEDNSSILKVGCYTFNALPLYINSILVGNINDIIDKEKIMDKIASDQMVNGKKLYMKAFNKVDLASIIKETIENDTMDENNDLNVYNIDKLTEKQLDAIFSTKNIKAVFDMYYCDNKEERISEYNIENLMEKIQRGFTQNIKFGKQTVSFSLKDIYSIACNDESYVYIDSEKGLLKSNEAKDLLNVNKVIDMDETPATADSFQLLLVGGIAVMAALLGVAFYIRRKSY